MKKLTAISAITLTAFVGVLPTQVQANTCHSGQMSFQELTYASKQELIAEYCRTSRIQDIYRPRPNAGIQERRDYAARLDACANYYNQMARVLRKDHNVEPNEIKCK